MITESLKEQLIKAGLFKQEIVVYTYLLKKGEARIFQICRETGVTRITVYAVLKTLMEKGLVSRIEKGKNQAFFSAEPPVKVVGLLESRVMVIQKSITELRDSVGELEALYQESKDKRPKVVFYEGIEGLKKCRQDIIDNAPGEAYEIVNADNNPLDDQEYQKDVTRYSKYNINFQSLYTSRKGEIFKDSETAIYIPYDKYPKITADIVIFKDKVIITSYRGSKPKTVYIDEKSIAETFKEIFRMLKDYLQK